MASLLYFIVHCFDRIGQERISFTITSICFIMGNYIVLPRDNVALCIPNIFGCQGCLQGVEFKITWRLPRCPLLVCMIVNGSLECQCYTRQGRKCRTRQENKRESLRKSIERRQNTHLAASWILLVFVTIPTCCLPLSTLFFLPGVFPYPMSIVQTFDQHCNLDEGKVINDPIHVRECRNKTSRER